jgi:undecaprenyl diphosphate synthase
MDGNGRWAERRGRPRVLGHRAGVAAVRRSVEWAARRGIGVLTLYAFSGDNWKRPAAEVKALLRLFEAHLRTEAAKLAAQGIRLEIIGRRDRLPARLLAAIVAAEQATAAGGAMRLRIAIDYSARHEIERRLATGAGTADLVDVDLLVRTGGERRLSDFLLWECAYAELAFLDVLWPDLTAAHLEAALADFATRDRRFGALPVRRTA